MDCIWTLVDRYTWVLEGYVFGKNEKWGCDDWGGVEEVSHHLCKRVSSPKGKHAR